MKKFFALFLTLAMVLSLAACGAKEEAPAETPAETPADAPAGPDDVDLKELAANYDGEIHVSVWGKDSVGDNEGSRGYLVNKMAEEFSAMYDNVTIEYIHQGGYDEVAEKVRASSVAGDLPNIFMTEESMVKGFSGVLADLRDYMPSATIADYQPGMLVSMMGENGEVYGAPFARSLPVLHVNKELLAAAGWSGDQIKTNEDMFQCAKDVYEKTGAYGMCCFWDTDAWHWESAVYADGGSILTPDGSAPAIGADYDYVGGYYLNQVKEGLIEGYIVSPYGTPKPADTRDDLFCSGQVGLMLTSCNSMPKRANKLAESGYTFESYVQPAGKGGEYGIVSGGSNWCMTNTGTYEEMMFGGAFLAYMAEKEQVLRITKNTGSMMVTTSAYESEEGQATFVDQPYTKSIYESVPYLHERPNTNFWAEMYLYTVDKLEQLSLYPAETNVEEMVDDLSTKFAQIIEDNTW